MSTIITGEICGNTCLGYAPGDNTPDYLGLFGPPLAELSGPFTLNIGPLFDTLTINGHPFTFAVTDPHYSISFTSPLLASFSPGAAVFTAIGANPFGIAIAETEYLCPVPGVPEPSTFMLLLLAGFVFAGKGMFVGFNRGWHRCLR